MKATKEERKALVDRLADLFTLPEFDDRTMVTASSLAKRMKISPHTSLKRLEALVEAGELEVFEVRGKTGKKEKAYGEKKERTTAAA